MATLGQLSPHRLSGGNSTLAFDVERVRKDFPVLAEHVHGKPLVYLDSGASAQKPTAVLEAMDEVRSEKHTSELQSLMRISYAVFCLKKKKKNKNIKHKNNIHYLQR